MFCLITITGVLLETRRGKLVGYKPTSFKILPVIIFKRMVKLKSEVSGFKYLKGKQQNF